MRWRLFNDGEKVIISIGGDDVASVALMIHLLILPSHQQNTQYANNKAAMRQANQRVAIAWKELPSKPSHNIIYTT